MEGEELQVQLGQRQHALACGQSGVMAGWVGGWAFHTGAGSQASAADESGHVPTTLLAQLHLCLDLHREPPALPTRSLPALSPV